MEHFSYRYLRNCTTATLEHVLQHVLRNSEEYDLQGIVILILDILSERENAPRYDIKPYVLRSATKFIKKHAHLFESL